ncbi:hypothetical protein [Rhodococcus sp. NPDC060176]|uniref:hypothetical protein n=1 Tax=Rhodococcus sp. NPDC060176 TaxID=3347062 RepID=UPI0036516148
MSTWTATPADSASNELKLTNTHGSKLAGISIAPAPGATVRIIGSSDKHTLNGPVEAGGSFNVIAKGGGFRVLANDLNLRSVHWDYPE